MNVLKAIIVTPVKIAYWSATTSMNAVVGSAAFIGNVRKWRDKDLPAHGTASYATDKVLKASGHLNPGGFYMGVSSKGKRLYSHPERSGVLMAPPGMGKSQHFIAYLKSLEVLAPEKRPYLIVSDPANELYRECAPVMAAVGYNIAKISLTEPNQWTKYDVLAELDPHDTYQYDDDLKRLCELFIPDEPNSKQPHFLEFARLLLKCVITVNVKYEGNRKTIGELVSELVLESKREALFKRIKPYNDDYVTAVLDTISKMGDKPEGLSMMSTALRKLEPWSNAAVKEVTTYGPNLNGQNTRGWTWEQMLLHPEPFVLFINTGTNQGGGALSRVIYGNAINAVGRIWNKTDRPLSRELRVVIDEAGLVGYCNAVVHGFERLRKAGVRVMLCFLSMEEFHSTYKESATIWSGSDVAVWGGSRDMKLYKEVSEFIGDKTIQNKNYSQSDHGESKGYGEQARRLIKPDELMRMEYEEQILLLGTLTVKCGKTFRRTKDGVKHL
jgi:type IV secretory pathway TraG/TraD family ATPase VirD4